MGIPEILRRIWLPFANKTKKFESFSKQPTQLIIELNSSLRHIVVTKACSTTTVARRRPIGKLLPHSQ